MIDVYMIKKKNVVEKFNQKELEAMTRSFIYERFHHSNLVNLVKRYKNSTLAKDLNKAIGEGTHPVLLIGYVGFEVPKMFDDEVIEKFAATDKLGMMGFKILDVNSRIVDAGIENPTKKMPIWRGFDESCNNIDTRFEEVNIFIDGNFCLIKRSDFNEVGGFDPIFNQLWAVDVGFRIGQKGRKILYTPKEITHYNYFERDLNKLTQTYADDVKAFTYKYIDKLVSPKVVEAKNGK